MKTIRKVDIVTRSKMTVPPPAIGTLRLRGSITATEIRAFSLCRRFLSPAATWSLVWKGQITCARLDFTLY